MKKGELVWVSLNHSDSWIPGRILDPSEPLGVLVSFFDLMEPRYVPKPYLRSFECDFGALVADSWRFRRFVNRALRAHFWNISFGLWCSCQPPIESPDFDRESSLARFPLSTGSALGFVRDMAVSLRVPLRRLAETNSSSAQILSFRRYSVDFGRSESVYEEIRESAKLMESSGEPDWCLDPSNNLVSMFPETDVENSRELSLRDPFPKDIPCCSSPSFEPPVDKEIQICTWNTRKPQSNIGSSIMKACETMSRTVEHEDDGHPSKIRERCQVVQSICLLNLEPAIEEIIEYTSNAASPRPAVSEAPPDDMIEAYDGITGSGDRTVTSGKEFSLFLDGSQDKAFLAKPVSFAVLETCKNQACSVKETYANPRTMLDSSMIGAKSLDEESSDKNAFNGTRENCSDDALMLDTVEVGQDSVQNLEAAATVKNQTRGVDNVRSIGVKRKASRDKASGKSKRKKKAGQESISTDKPQNLQLLKDMHLADPKCLRMKFLSRHVNLPSKSELLKRFSVFGKIDASRTDVNPGESSAKVVFLQSIDAVTAYQFARSKKFNLGRSKVMYRLDALKEETEVNKVPVSQKPQESFEEETEVNKVPVSQEPQESFEEETKVNKAPVSQKPQKSVPLPRSCLKKHGSVDKEEGRSPPKVKFQMETN